MSRIRLSLFLLFVLAGLAPAQTPTRCIICQSVISGSFYWWEGPTLQGKQPVCETCSKLETTCYICKLPIRHHVHKLDDGRSLCEKDYAAGIFSQNAALRVYEETWRDVQRILAGTGTLPRQNITVTLVEATQLIKLYQSLPSDHDDRTLMGLTRTRVSPSHQFQHQIFLVTGLGPARLAAVCAHEYTHTWLHENVPDNRKLDRDTIEGFCELIAYKLMAQRQEEMEKRIILANAYTRGQVNAFIQAETDHHFHRVVNWVKTGVDNILVRTNSGRLLALRRPEPEPVVWPPPAPLPTAVPETLVLKGISGSRQDRLVLINDCTLAKNEEGRVRVGTSNVVIRCMEIRERSAVIRVKGRQETTELFLGSLQ